MSKREIILDTETTGLDPLQGHRIIEIACIELNNFLPTGKVFHQYINPLRDVPLEATRVHGITTEFLQDFKTFPDHAAEFLDFIGDTPLVIHNREFDIKFLNAELERINLTKIPLNRAIDTVFLARKKFPNASVSLDALCKRFSIDLSKREKHNALIDCELLAEVYLELQGGRQSSFVLFEEHKSEEIVHDFTIQKRDQIVPPRAFPLEEEEQNAHKAFIANIPQALWGK